MPEPALIAEQRKLIRGFQAASAQLAQAEKDAQTQHQQRLASGTQAKKAAQDRLNRDCSAAEAIVSDIRKQASARVNQVRELFNEAENLLGKNRRRELQAGVSALHSPNRQGGDPAKEIDACAEQAKESFARLKETHKYFRANKAVIKSDLFDTMWDSCGNALAFLIFVLPVVFTISFLIDFFIDVPYLLIGGPIWKNLSNRRVCISLLHYINEAEYWQQQWIGQAQQTCQQKIAGVQAQYQQDIDRISQEEKEAQAQYQSDIYYHIQAYQQEMVRLRAALAALNNSVETLSPAWNHSSWHSWPHSGAFPPVTRLGNLQATFLQEIISLPALFPFPGERSLIFKAAGPAKAVAVQTIQSFLLHLLATIPPGKLQFTFLDPLGLGQNVAPFMHLADDDEALVTSKAWTEPLHLEQRLADLTEQMETIIQKYLRNQYRSIEEYNQQAGEIEEPYRILVALDFPTNFSEIAARRLLSIAANGPRCGVYTVILVDTTQAPPYGFNQADLESTGIVISWDGQHFVYTSKEEVQDFLGYPIQLDIPPGKELFEPILRTVGQRAKAAKKVEVPFGKMLRIFGDQLTTHPADYPGLPRPIMADDPTTWWSGETSGALIAPLGRAGATKAQCLDVGKGTSHHALVAGRVGSGKSTLLHTLIMSLALTYSPNEVELYLIDFKKGVEFKTYATAQLPHARVIAIESEREFGLSVLQGLDTELKRRGDLFRGVNADRLDDYRQKSHQLLARILLLVDEFQEFFTEDDAIATQSAQMLDRLVRQGRAFGMHVLLGSQTLAGAYTLARATIDQMAVRIALQCSEADSRLILADDNHEARLLSRPGEAIYNDQNGRIEGNNRFQVAWLPEDEQQHYLEVVRRKAQEQRYQPPAPPIIFEGNVPAQVELNHPLAATLAAPDWPTLTQAPHAWIGDPIAIRPEPTYIHLRPQSGANFLLVGQHEQMALGMLTSALISLAAQHAPQTAQFYGLDFTLADAPFGGVLERLGHLLLPRMQMSRRRDLPVLINTIAAEVDRRLNDDARGLPTVYFILFGLQRARDLRVEEDFSFSSSEESAPNPAKQFAHILREGPEMKVHTLVWCDTLTNLTRTLEHRVLREFGIRAALQMSADDSSALIDTPGASKLGTNRALLFVEDEGKLEKFRPYDLPSQTWLETVCTRLQQKAL